MAPYLFIGNCLYTAPSHWIPISMFPIFILHHPTESPSPCSLSLYCLIPLVPLSLCWNFSVLHHPFPLNPHLHVPCVYTAQSHWSPQLYVAMSLYCTITYTPSLCWKLHTLLLYPTDSPSPSCLYSTSHWLPISLFSCLYTAPVLLVPPISMLECLCIAPSH